MPPLPDDLSDAMREALISLEALGDDSLWQVMRAEMPLEQYQQLAELQ
jgi:hypothetical protein